MNNEQLAIDVIGAHLGQPVELNDDQSENGLYDLRVGPRESPIFAIECVRAVDSGFAELCNIGPAKGPWILPIRGDWRIGIGFGTRLKRLKRELPDVLSSLEAVGRHGLRVDYDLLRRDPRLHAKLSDLGIESANLTSSNGSGRVYLMPPGIGGAVDSEGSQVPTWLGEFLRAESQSDVLEKLLRSVAPQKHACVIVTMHGATWPVFSYLTQSQIARVPALPPTLPYPLTGAWILSEDRGHGIYWDGGRWEIVNARV